MSVPVLYPEVSAEEPADVQEGEAEEPIPEEIADLVREEEDEELVVSKWPDPAESGG